MKTRNTILLLILTGCVAALPVVAGLDLPILVVLAIVAVPVGWQTWQLIHTVAAHEADLERRLIAWQYQRLAQRAARLLQREQEAR